MWFQILLPNHSLAAMAKYTCGSSLDHVFIDRFDTLVIQGKDVLPVLSSHELVTPDVVILNAFFGSQFCHQCGRDLRATNYLPSCTFSRSWIQDFIEKAVAPVPWMDFFSERSSVFHPRCDKRLATPEIIDLHTDTEQRTVELLTKVLPHHHPLDIPRVRAFASFGPKDVSSDYLEQEASKGKGAFIQALWTLYAKSNLYRLAYKVWKRHGPQNLTAWTLLAQAVLDGCYAEKWPDTVFQVPDVCSICLSPMHWPEKTHCGHGFHLRCLTQHLDVSNTCPLCRAPYPLRAS
ncbi:hypothetical protein TNCV_1337211 [Trichonephila clavipes]|nr:hypothetical protein TNCV_1337211 [Trichonephila clavipes]